MTRDIRTLMREEAEVRLGSCMHDTQGSVAAKLLTTRGIILETYDGVCMPVPEEHKLAILDFEHRFNALVYYVMYAHSVDFGDTITLLYVSNRQEEWEYERKYLKEGHPFAYIVNLANPVLSERRSVSLAQRKYSVLERASNV